jgi:hypothetical protein
MTTTSPFRRNVKPQAGGNRFQRFFHTQTVHRDVQHDALDAIAQQRVAVLPAQAVVTVDRV